jgi:hypothetical protein
MFVLFQCSPLLRRAVPDMNMRPRPSAYPRLDDPTKLGTNPGRTYRFFTGNAVFPCETHLQPSAPVPVCCVSLSEPVQLWHLLQSNAHYSRVVSYGLSYVNFSYSHVVAATNEDRGTPEAVSLAMLPQLLSQQKHGFVPSTATATVDPGFSINVTNTTRSIHHVQSITFNPSRSIHHVQSITFNPSRSIHQRDQHGRPRRRRRRAWVLDATASWPRWCPTQDAGGLPACARASAVQPAGHAVSCSDGLLPRERGRCTRGCAWRLDVVIWRRRGGRLCPALAAGTLVTRLPRGILTLTITGSLT